MQTCNIQRGTKITKARFVQRFWTGLKPAPGCRDIWRDATLGGWGGVWRQGGFLEVCEALVRGGGASVHVQGECECSAAHEAARHGHTVRSLLL